MKKIKSVLLVLLTLALLLAGCGGGEASSDAVNTAQSEVGTDTAEKGDGGVIDLSDYKIIRADAADSLEATAAGNFLLQMKKKTGVTLDIGTDFVKKGTEPGGEAKEILIGETNRPESVQVKAECPQNGYCIRVVDDKLVILGANALMTVTAVDAFFQRILMDDSAVLSADTEVIEENNLPVNLREGQWTIVRCAGDSSTVAEAVAEFRSQAKKALGKDVKMATDSKSPDANEILIGDTNRNESVFAKREVSTQGYVIRVLNSKIVICGGNESALIKAMNALLSMMKADATTLEADHYTSVGSIYMPTDEDKHTVLESVDDSKLDELFAIYQLYRGDAHMHSGTGPNGDGQSTLAQLTEQAKSLGFDFLMCCDHRQTTHVDDVDWDRSMFISSTEPGLRMLDGEGQPLHYILYAPTPDAYKQIFEHFADLYKYDAASQTFTYPRLTEAQLKEVVEYVQSIGGNFVWVHPMNYYDNKFDGDTTMASPTDPMFFYVMDGTIFEVLYASTGWGSVGNNYLMWSGMLLEGKKVYASAGTDSHDALFNNGTIQSIWATERQDSAYVAGINSGLFIAGDANIRMAIDDTLMGGTVAYKDGMKLRCSISDVRSSADQYRIRVYTEQGVAYEKVVDKNAVTNFEIDVQDRSFYRVEIASVNGNMIYALSQPIWLS